MAFPSSAKTKNEPQSASRQVSLIRVWHYRRVEEGSRFQRILSEEIRADQETSLFGKWRIGQQHLANLIEAFPKTPVELVMSLGELS